mmetsp:Transcript_124048/g.185397  ORF Transcript_124048/g.185397 Transcript_124048/m.185397 type:complete len:100 (+) Transcript_124048:233-532(+)|eukprot:CAMPEP_0117084422 /NCGR_PEP_ID=MMETSP0472-20121206/59411_1 /TAXON_ID=693140 ORGANISM="Tiarina fusus, Strain LIS" /NCGR_SAMPLE_ID=MMETSP0472 /ASSEMBLY_ACC=CAM_ASM_000603 /LENGTH=99 /DNA_ID=CAMNT_0004813393 /DNA_START=134 /DNA_END=433 /DNA_ORIENTATION=-
MSNAILDLEASPIPGQTGWAVLDLQGTVVRCQSLQDQDCKLLFQMLQESATILTASPANNKEAEDIDGLRRLTVTFAQSRFVVTRDESHVYLVQTRVGT